MDSTVRNAFDFRIQCLEGNRHPLCPDRDKGTRRVVKRQQVSGFVRELCRRFVSFLN